MCAPFEISLERWYTLVNAANSYGDATGLFQTRWHLLQTRWHTLDNVSTRIQTLRHKIFLNMLKKVGRVSAKCKLLEGRCGNGTGLLDYGGHLLCYVYISCHMPVDLLHGTRRERMEVAAIQRSLIDLNAARGAGLGRQPGQWGGVCVFTTPPPAQ